MKQEGKSRKKELKCWHYLWWQEFSLLFSVVGRDVVLRTKYNWCGNVLAQNESKNKKQNDNRQDGLTLEEIKGKFKIGEIYILKLVCLWRQKQQTPIGTNRNRVKTYKQGQNYKEDTKRRDYREENIDQKRKEISSGQIIRMLQLERERVRTMQNFGGLCGGAGSRREQKTCLQNLEKIVFNCLLIFFVKVKSKKENKKKLKKKEQNGNASSQRTLRLWCTKIERKYRDKKSVCFDQ